VAAIAIVAGVVGCSGDGAKDLPPGPLPAALSYLPAGSGAVFVVETDPEGGPYRRLDRLGSRSPRWMSLKKRIEAEFRKQGLDFERIVRPQLGNPFAFAITPDGTRVGAIQVTDPAALRRSAELRIAAGEAQRLDDYEGALVWKEKAARGSTLRYSAARESELVVAGSERGLKDAIDSARGSDSMAFDAAFASALRDLGRDFLIRGVGDARRLLQNADPGQAAEARRIPWVNALGMFTLTAGVERRGIGIDFELRTDRARLTAGQLPLAAGARPPRLHDSGATASLALRDPEQLIRFGEKLLRVRDPDRFHRYQAGVDQTRAFLGVDFHKHLLSRITNLSVAAVSPTAATFVGTLQPGSERTFAGALDRAKPLVEGILRELTPGTNVEARGSGPGRVWYVKNRGFTLARYSVRGGALVGAVGLSELPKAVRGRRLVGARGALSLKGDPKRIASFARVIPGIPGVVFRTLSGLGDLTLSVRAEPRALTARGRIEVR
jgi:hypothetical protein